MNSKTRLIAFVFTLLTAGVSESFAQSITDFTPKFGSVGETVRINGSGFSGVTNVIFFNGKSVRVNPTSPSQINAVVPAGAMTGAITVVKGANQATTVEDFTVIGHEPYVSDYSPFNGSGGTVVIMNGVHFTGVTNAKFNGVNGTITQLTSDTQIRVQAPMNVTTGPISLTRSNLTFTTSSNFFAPAAITNFAPSSAVPGTTIVIKGRNFLGTTVLKFNQVVAPNFTVDSNTQITATLPANATTGLININPPGGQANSSSNFVVLPAIYSFSPPLGKLGTNVTIVGANLLGNTVVKFNGSANATLTTLTATQIVATVPASATSGFISVTTTNGTATSPSIFYLPPTISGFNPSTGAAGTGVTITGVNFTNATDVSFNGTSASFSVFNNGLINATVPVGAMTGPISVTTPGGTTNTAPYFWIKPAVTGFSPSIGVPGVPVTIFGSSFTNATEVLFNGVSASFTPGSNTELTAIVPAAATTGPISVIAQGGTGVSAENFVIEALALSVKLLTNGPVVISWTTNAPGFALQANTSLNSTNWVAITNAPVIVSGKNTVTNSPTNSATYYRLKK